MAEKKPRRKQTGYKLRSFRLPQHTIGQIDELAEKLGMTRTAIVLLALDHYYQEKGGKR